MQKKIKQKNRSNLKETQMEKQKIILDCDPGHDDAIAIMVAGGCPDIEILGITITHGNNYLRNVTRNALNICQWLELDVPVYVGCEVPLVRDLVIPPGVTDPTGMRSNFPFPPLTKKAEEKGAVDFIIETIQKYPGEVTLIPTGPMSNIGLAMRKEPAIIPLIKQIYFMGGAREHGNVNGAAEFNIWADPEAASIVINSGVPLVMMGLDVTRKALCLPEVIERIGKLNNRASKLFVELMTVFSEGQKRMYGWLGAPVHDATCVAYLIDPSFMETKDMLVEVDLSHGPSYGRTNCDGFFILGDSTSNVKVCTDLNPNGFWEIVEKSLKNYK